jgi:hypothetical protein
MNAPDPIITLHEDDTPPPVGIAIDGAELSDGSWVYTIRAGKKLYGSFTIPAEDVEKLKQGIQP